MKLIKLGFLVASLLLTMSAFGEVTIVEVDNPNAPPLDAPIKYVGGLEVDAGAAQSLPGLAVYSKGVNPLVKSCNSAAKTAQTLCRSQTNPKIMAATAMIGGLMSAISMASLVESCSKFEKAMNVAQTALTAYNGMCSAAMAYCTSSCGSLKSSEPGINASSTKTANANPTSAAVDAGAIAKESTRIQGEVAYAVSKCEGYKMNLAAAGMGLMGVMNQKGLADKCNKDTTTVDCNDPMNAMNETCKKPLDCNKPENAQNTTCICNKAPSTPGCPTSPGTQASDMPTGDNGIGSDASSSNLNAGSAPNFQAPAADGMPTISPTGGGLGGIDGGSGAGGGNGFSGGGGGGADGEKKDGKKLNTNILGGYEGGGGGGGGRGGSSANSQYGAYMPGAANDPSRKVAGAAEMGPVTGAGAKSNWEKVRERYGANKSSLTGW